MKRNIELKNEKGEIIFSKTNVEVPLEWSETAGLVYAQKYMHKKHENSIVQTISRMVNAWYLKGAYGDLFSLEDCDKMFKLILDQKFAPNSPQWFNTGVELAYNAENTSGVYYHYDSTQKAAVKTQRKDFKSQAHACFILPIADDLFSEDGIFTHVKKEALIFKNGSGCGTNFSSIRGKGESLSSGGTSSGVLSFLQIFDKAAGSVKSGGTTRRAAKMCILNDDHPDLFEFINWKVNEEKKAQALINSGYSAHYEGDAYTTVSGQNSNNSILISDNLIRQYKDKGGWRLNKIKGGYIETTAEEVINSISEAAWVCADPGVQFKNTINTWHTCKNSGPIISSNPCSEYFFLENTACNLGSINLLRFLKEDNTFDIDEFIDTVRIATTVLDITNEIAKFPSPEIAEQSYKFRTIGLGYANLGALLMVLGMPYDSDSGRQFAAALTSLLTAVAYNTSVDLAAKLGPFLGYEENKESVKDVIELHKAYSEGFDPLLNGVSIIRTAENEKILNKANEYWEKVVDGVAQHGIRNAQLTAIAPTGTIGLLMDCDTTGIEPDFSLTKYKSLSGGGVVKIVNKNVERALKHLKYSGKDISDILDYIEKNDKLEGCEKIKKEHLPIFDCAVGERFISVDGHLLMLAYVQPFVSGGISKTINMPNSATSEDIKNCYLKAHKLGIKSVSIYRDGCKSSQPLNTADEPKQIKQKRALSNRRRGTTHKVKIAGQNLFVRTGEFENGDLGEIFLDMYKEGSTLRAMLNCFAIAVSVGLQHGVPLSEFVEKFIFTRFEPAGTVDHDYIKNSTSILDTVFRLLEYEYLGNAHNVHVKNNKECSTSSNADSPNCPTCGAITVRTGTCYGCPVCGTSLGCS